MGGGPLIVRRAFGYQASVGLAVGAYFAVLLANGGARPGPRAAGIIGLVVAAVVLYHPLGDRVRFTPDQVEYVNPLGRVTTAWPLDGTSRLDLEQLRTPSRWGLTAKAALVLKTQGGDALALPPGRYTREAAWKRLLLVAGAGGHLHVSAAAKVHLSAGL